MQASLAEAFHVEICVEEQAHAWNSSQPRSHLSSEYIQTVTPFENPSPSDRIITVVGLFSYYDEKFQTARMHALSSLLYRLVMQMPVNILNPCITTGWGKIIPQAAFFPVNLEP